MKTLLLSPTTLIGHILSLGDPPRGRPGVDGAVLGSLAMARTEDPESGRKSRGRVLKALLMGGAAVGLPALANAIVGRRQERLATATWGRPRTYPWKYGEISFQSLGQGPPLTLLHGFGPGHDGEEWRPAAEILAGRFTVHVPDLLGWGRSGKPRLPLDAELYIGLIEAFLEDVVAATGTVLAVGDAAAYAVDVAVRRPDLIGALALVGPRGLDLHAEGPELRGAVVDRLLGLPIVRTSALNLLTSRSAIVQYLKREAFRHPEQVDAGRVEHHYRSSHQPGSHVALAAYLSGALDHSVGAVVGDLSVPLWLGWGRHANDPPVEVADLWLHLVPAATLEVFEDSANLPHLEQPAAFARLLLPFLEQVPL